MNDQPTSSGSRWEPADQTNQPAQDDAAEAAAAEPTYAGPTYATPSSRIPGRSRAIAAGVAVGLLGVGGLGGLAIGAASSGGGRGDETSVVDVDGPFGDGRPPGSDQHQGQPAPDRDGDDQVSTATDPGSRT